jgi:hypothetical protein
MCLKFPFQGKAVLILSGEFSCQSLMSLLTRFLWLDAGMLEFVRLSDQDILGVNCICDYIKI